MYRTARFRYHGNVDWLFDRKDRVVEPGGRSLAESIVVALRAEGGMRVSDVEQHEDYGWGFESTADDGAFFQVLNAISADEIYLTVQSGAWRRTTTPHARDAYCATVEAALGAIPGVTGVEWDAWRT